MTDSTRTILTARIRRIATAALLAALFAAPVFGQAREVQPKELIEDFVHYTLIARPDLAAGAAEKLLERGLTNAEIAVVVENTVEAERWDRALEWGLRVDTLEDLATELGARTEQGRRDLAREGDRIAEAIQMLSGTQRQKLLARGRLLAAGEYAVPALLHVITEAKNEVAGLQCRKMIIEVGRPAVTPLCVALGEIDPVSQRIICEMLAEIGYPHASPYLLELSQNGGASEMVREAARRAFGRVGGIQADLSDMFAVLADQYYRGRESLVPYPFEDTNNIWSYDAFVGLVAMPVPTEIFSEIMAMKQAEHALGISAENRTALGIYVAANLKRENDIPRGEDDPVYGDRTYSPEFFGTLFGTEICLDVLAMALDTNDTPLVRDAIAALAKTTGSSNLINVGVGRAPLLEALGYPDRRVQYEAALALGRALPTQSFDGDWRVVPILASAVRTGGENFAVIISDDDENRRLEAAAAEGAGFTVVGQAESAAMAADGIASATAVDLVVIRMNDMNDTRNNIEQLRAFAKTGAAPVMIICPAIDKPVLEREYASDAQVLVSNAFQDAGAREAALDELFGRATGGRITESEAEAYAFDALATLEDIAIAASPAFDIADAESSLIDSLGSRSGSARMLVARILAHMDSDRAQQALWDAALSSGATEQIDLLTHVADSVKRFGDRAEERHVAGLIRVIEMSEGQTAEAAARVHGALNLRKTDAVKLIFKEG